MNPSSEPRRPDVRFLCPVEIQPWWPEGAREWFSSGDLFNIRTNTLERHNPPTPGHMIDFSAPRLRDGRPDRFDILTWGLQALHWQSRAVRKSLIRGFELLDDIGHVTTVIHQDPLWATAIYVAAWPDMHGLSLSDSCRAAVVAALIARRP